MWKCTEFIPLTLQKVHSIYHIGYLKSNPVLPNCKHAIHFKTGGNKATEQQNRGQQRRISHRQTWFSFKVTRHKNINNTIPAIIWGMNILFKIFVKNI